MSFGLQGHHGFRSCQQGSGDSTEVTLKTVLNNLETIVINAATTLPPPHFWTFWELCGTSDAALQDGFTLWPVDQALLGYIIQLCSSIIDIIFLLFGCLGFFYLDSLLVLSAPLPGETNPSGSVHAQLYDTLFVPLVQSSTDLYHRLQ